MRNKISCSKIFAISAILIKLRVKIFFPNCKKWGKIKRIKRIARRILRKILILIRRLAKMLRRRKLWNNFRRIVSWIVIRRVGRRRRRIRKRSKIGRKVWRLKRRLTRRILIKIIWRRSTRRLIRILKRIIRRNCYKSSLYHWTIISWSTKKRRRLRLKRRRIKF